MDGPPPPRDASLRNIIDKLAEFVARNGPEFEMITKQKQQNNPKFEFLYGGEFAGYYQYRVGAEQMFLKQGPHSQNPSQPHHMHNQQQSHFSQGPPPTMHLQQQQLPLQSSNAHDTSGGTYGISQPPPNNHMWNANSSNAPQQANGNSIALSLTAQIEAINMQQSGLREQIHQSESNLSAQHSALMAQQKKQIDEAIEAAQNAQMEKQAEENGIKLAEFTGVLQPIIESCTKDSISAGKNWILQHSSDSAKNIVVLQYLLKNVRKNVNDLKNSLENVVIPMFCSADLIANSDQRAKLTKLLSLWESKAKFFDACVISKLKSPDSSMQEYKTNLQNLHHDIAAKFAKATKATLDNYQKQHQIFIQHATQQITQLEQQKQQLEQQMHASVLPNTSVMPPQAQQQQQHQSTHQQQHQTHQPPHQQQVNKIPSLMSQKISMPGSNDSDHMQPPGVDDSNYGNNNSNIYQQQQQQSNNAYGVVTKTHFPQQQQQQTTPSSKPHNPFATEQSPGNFFIPDLSKPPPGFMSGVASIAAQLPASLQQQLAQMVNIPPTSSGSSVSGDNSNPSANITVDILAVNAALQLVQQQKKLQQQQQQQQQLQQLKPDILLSPQQQQQQQQQLDDDDEVPPPPPLMTEEEQRPSAPYYDLPAGLMVPLIRLEDYNYKSLNPADIRLPPPAPQSERLTNALAAFYAPPTHDRPRDNEGWEKLGLYEYYKVKNAARKQKEDEVESGIREKSRSPSPIVAEKPKPKKINKRCYRSKSRSRSRSRSPYRSPPPPRPRENRTGRNNNRYNQRTRSPRRSSPQRGERDSSNSSIRENRAERNNVKRDRSVTPPSFFGSTFAKPNEFIEESNKGHQMLMKMGWAGTGTGLGQKNQGIDQPISGGEIRDRKDMYKGVGLNVNDPFENFRKNKGAAFVHRMRARDDKS